MIGRSPIVRPNSWHRLLPSLITSLRIAVVPAIWILWIHQIRPAMISVYGFVLLSDAFDGWLARRLNAVTRFGGFFDAITDIAVILSLLALLGTVGAVPFWVPIGPGVLATVFLATSSRAAPRYDPLGKYYGAGLYVVGGALLWGVGPVTRTVLSIVVPIMSAAVLVSRWLARPKPAARRSN